MAPDRSPAATGGYNENGYPQHTPPIQQPVTNPFQGGPPQAFVHAPVVRPAKDAGISFRCTSQYHKEFRAAQMATAAQARESVELINVFMLTEMQFMWEKIAQRVQFYQQGDPRAYTDSATWHHPYTPPEPPSSPPQGSGQV